MVCPYVLIIPITKFVLILLLCLTEFMFILPHLDSSPSYDNLTKIKSTLRLLYIFILFYFWLLCNDFYHIYSKSNSSWSLGEILTSFNFAGTISVPMSQNIQALDDHISSG